MRTAFALLVLSVALTAQPVRITVDPSTKLGPYRQITSYFGYDEPNYTYMANGKKLIG